MKTYNLKLGRLTRDLVAQSNSTMAINQLVRLWNSLTAPWVLRTEYEHNRCRRYARAIRSRIERQFTYGVSYHENEDGRLIAESEDRRLSDSTGMTADERAFIG